MHAEASTPEITDGPNITAAEIVHPNDLLYAEGKLFR